jgi:PAS domain S-box-containing protein
VLRRRRSCERASGLGTLVADGAARTIARGAGLAGQAWESGEPVYEPCFAPDRGYREAAAANACGLSASLAVPVAGATDVLAVVVFHLREGSPRSAALLHFVSAVIAQLSAPLARVSVDLAVQHIARGPCALFDSLADFVVTTDMDGRIAYCNDAFLSAMQRVRVPVIGGDVFTLFSTDPVRDRARVRRAIEGRRVAPVELDLRGGDGVRRRVRWQGVVMASDDGVPQGIAAIGTDVTEAYRSRRTNDILAESIDGTREAIVLVDADGRVGWLNRRFAALLDMPRESVVGASLPTLAAERVGQYALDALVDYCKAGVRVRADHEHRLPGGERVMLRTAFDPVRDDEGRVLHYLATMRDVTSERARQRELLRLSSAVHVSTEGIAVTDGLGNFVVVNEAFAQLHGYALTSDLHGTPWQGRIAPTVPATYTLEILRALARHGTWTGDLAVRRRDGTELVARYALSMLDDDGVVIAAHDQTARIAAERDLVRARDAAEAATRAQANFVSVVSHELRTPLNAIIGFSNIVVKRSGARLDDKDRDYLARVREGGMTLLTLIDEILTHAKVEAGSLSIERSRVDVGALVHDVARLGEGLKRGPGVTMRVDVQPGLPAAFVDPLRLTQVVTNLVSNALKFTEAGAVVLSLTGTSDGGLQLVVSDSGIGIPPERLEAIWKPFEQAEAGTTRRFGGTGLGLPIVRSLATLMGLSVDVTSRVGTGSVFTVRIPPQWVLPEPERASTATSLANRGSPILKTS